MVAPALSQFVSLQAVPHSQSACPPRCSISAKCTPEPTIGPVPAKTVFGTHYWPGAEQFPHGLNPLTSGSRKLRIVPSTACVGHTTSKGGCCALHRAWPHPYLRLIVTEADAQKDLCNEPAIEQNKCSGLLQAESVKS